MCCLFARGSTNVWDEPTISSLLAFGRITGWSVKMEDSKPYKKLVGLATKRCAKINGGYLAVASIKLSNFSHLQFRIQG